MIEFTSQNGCPGSINISEHTLWAKRLNALFQTSQGFCQSKHIGPNFNLSKLFYRVSLVCLPVFVYLIHVHDMTDRIVPTLQ